MKRVFALFLAIAILTPALTPASFAAFSDVTDASTLQAVQLLSNLGIVTAADKYRPGDILDKASYCKLVVEIAGVENIDRFRDFTIFPDVRSNHWALPYINAAVRELKIVSGRPDGTFGPSNPISYNEAATLLVRLLGYSEAELGYNWPRNYVNKASSLGLDKNVKISGNVTRGQAAVLFYNLLFTKTRTEKGEEGPMFIDKMKSLEEPFDTVITDVNGLSPDGKTRGVLVTGGDGFYQIRSPLDASLAGRKGELLADTDGYLVRFLPDTQTVRAIEMKSVTSGSITGADGVKTNIPPSAVVYDNGSESKFSAVWSSIKRGDTIRVFFTSSGAVDYVIWGHDGADSQVFTTEIAGAQAIYNAFGISAAGLTIVKNGVVATPEAIMKYDTLSYVPGSGRISVSSLRISSPYKVVTSDKIDVAGVSCRMSEVAMAQAAGSFRVGDWFTACISSDGAVGALYPTSKVSSNAVGVATSDTSARMLNGLEFDVGAENAYTYKGMMVTVSGAASGINMSPLRMSGGSQSFDVKSQTVGKYKLADWCRIFTKTGDMVVPIEKSDLTKPELPVSHMEVNAQNMIELMVLENVNGDAYRYGFLDTGATVTGLAGEYTLNSGGEYTTVSVPQSVVSDKNLSGFVGVRLEVSNMRLSATDVVQTVQYTVNRSAFSGVESVMVDNARIPIAEDCLLRSGVSYVPLSHFSQYAGDTMEIYCDKPAGEGGKVRLIIIKK